MNSTNPNEQHDLARDLENMTKKLPIILCAGQNGRALIFGFVDSEPVPGEPVAMTDARMIFYYPSGGTFGLAADGPPEGSRVSAVVDKTVETVWQEWIAVSAKAVERFNA